MRIFFTGATGVIGSEAIPLLLDAGHEVVDARSMGLDLFDPVAVRKAVSGSDVVAHFATSIPSASRMAKREAWVTNDRLRTEATTNLVDAALAADVERFIQESVTFSYADGGDGWLDETSPVEPVWDILDSALFAEAETARFAAAGGAGVALRMSRLYGPGRTSAEFLDALRYRKMPIVGAGDNYVSSLHVADAGRAVVAALDASSGVYNVTDDEPVVSREFMLAAATAAGAPAPRRVPTLLARLAARRASRMLTVSHRVSNARFKNEAGWEPAHASAVTGWQAVASEVAKA